MQLASVNAELYAMNYPWKAIIDGNCQQKYLHLLMWKVSDTDCYHVIRNS